MSTPQATDMMPLSLIQRPCGRTGHRYFSLNVCNSFPTVPSVLPNNQHVTLKSISHLIP